MELVKIVYKSKKYKDKKGKEHCQVNYYLNVNGNYICIKPCFTKGYTQLDLVARTEIKD